MSALIEQHERWVAARERLGSPVRGRTLRLVTSDAKATVPVAVYPVSNAPEDWCERPMAPYDHCEPGLPPAHDGSPAQRVLSEVAGKYGYTLRLLRSADRTWPVCRARNEAVYRLRNELGLSRGTIGRLLGYRDITTIKSSEKAHAKRLATDRIFASDTSSFHGAGVIETVQTRGVDLHVLPT